jgi:hypothetical protein
MPKSVTTATHIVTLNSSSFRGILKSKYDLASICVDGRKELYFIVHKSLSCDLKICHLVSGMNRVCCPRYTVISMWDTLGLLWSTTTVPTCIQIVIDVFRRTVVYYKLRLECRN